MNAATAKILEFSQALRAGKLEWTTEEMIPYAIVVAGGAESTAKSRCATVARSIAGALNVSFDGSKQGRYVFGAPTSDGVLPQIVYRDVVKEVPVEKIVYKDAPRAQNQDRVKEDHETALVYPQTPEVPLPMLNYIKPPWYERMAKVLEAGKHVAIAGPPGGGKSTGPEQYFIKNSQPFVVVNGDAGLRRRDLEGSQNIDKTGSWFQVAEFAAAAVNGWGCILNEVNAADPDALLWLNGIIEVPNRISIGGRSFPVHPDFKLVVTYNPGLVGTKVLPQAFKDRFFPIKLGFPPKLFLRKLLAVKTGVSDSAPYLERLLKYAADCWTLHEKGNLRYQISPRRLFDVIFLLENVKGTSFEEAILQAIVHAVDSAADAQMLSKLITAPLAEVGAVSQFGVA